MNTAVILCYHKVGPESEEGKRLNIEPERLRTHVRFFQRRGYLALRACELQSAWPPRGVCFTFDDAYTSTMQHAPSVLEEFGIRGSFYAVAGKVGASSDWDGELARPLADWEALRRAQACGHEIGNHTRDHLHLGKLAAEEQVRQVVEAHEILARERVDSKSFCYPYGTLGVSGLLARCGYDVGLSLHKRVAKETDDRAEIPRIVVGFSDTIPLLLYKIYVRPKLP